MGEVVAPDFLEHVIVPTSTWRAKSAISVVCAARPVDVVKESSSDSKSNTYEADAAD